MGKRNMDFETLHEVVDKLIGPTRPYGDSRIDEDRLENLKLKTELVETLIWDIIEAGSFYRRKEHSIVQIANHAKEYLIILQEALNEEVEYIDDFIGADWLIEEYREKKERQITPKEITAEDMVRWWREIYRSNGENP